MHIPLSNLEYIRASHIAPSSSILPWQGPVYTERVLYAKVNEQGKVEIVDSLGLKLSAAGPLSSTGSTSASTSEARAAVFHKLERAELSPEDVDASCTLPASQKGYGDRACDCNGAAGLEVRTTYLYAFPTRS